MPRLFENIDKQIEFNRGKNIFAEHGSLMFARETVNAIARIDSVSPDDRQFLIDYATDKAIGEFCRVNQYYHFSSEARNRLRDIYARLFDLLQQKTLTPEEISQQHYENIRCWLKENNAFAEKIYDPEEQTVATVPCFEYTPALQIEILQIDVEHILQPVLDIGCGSGAHLVGYLTALGIEAYGIDRFKFSQTNIQTADWLEYDYGTAKWGTIISHMGFSNHFIHHNLRQDGDFLLYARTYMKILQSLQSGGSYHYAPDLPFIEKYLDRGRFEVYNGGVGMTEIKAKG